MSMIIPVWQKLFQSSHQIAQRIGQERGEPATHTGTLDPMAEGVLVVLTGEDRYLKGTLDWKKQYSFSILWGISTDSYDRLGMIREINPQLPRIDTIANILMEFPQTYQQVIPDFSARRWRGQSAHDLAKSQQALPQKTREVSLSALGLTGTELLELGQIREEHAHAVSHVVGDFRQTAILADWSQKCAQYPDQTQLLVTRHQVTTTPGTYIRQLVQDIATRVSLPALTWSIVRTQNGPF